MNKDLDELFARYGIKPVNRSLYELAFTHSSVNGMMKTQHRDYERLEFLGDAVIGMVVAELCFAYHPEMDEGKLSMLKAQFIRSDSESAYSKKLGLVEYIRIGRSFQAPLEEATSVLEDVFESFIGAIYTDQGVDFAYKFVRGVFEEDVKNATVNPDENPKSELQEAMQADHAESVHYLVLNEDGPSNDKTFTVAVYFENQELGRGTGKSKKIAEMEAARNALEKLAGSGEKN
jgi:ribonuclease-3